MNKEEFYSAVAEILGASHEYVDLEPRKKIGRDFKEYTPDTRYTRWGPRIPGNGRYPGHGVVRVMNETDVHLALYSPKLSGTFSMEKALEKIRSAVKDA